MCAPCTLLQARDVERAPATAAYLRTFRAIAWFCAAKDDCLPPSGAQPLVCDEGGEAMDDGTRVKIEHCAKRVRVYLGGKIIVDSIRSKLVWEVPHYPAYYFPMEDVSMNCLIESDRTERSSTRGEAGYFNVRSGSRLVANSA